MFLLYSTLLGIAIQSLSTDRNVVGVRLHQNSASILAKG